MTGNKQLKRTIILTREQFELLEDRLQPEERFVDTERLKTENAMNMILITPLGKKLTFTYEKEHTS